MANDFQLLPILPELVLVFGIVLSAFLQFFPKLRKFGLEFCLVVLFLAALAVVNNFYLEGRYFYTSYAATAGLQLVKLILVLLTGIALFLFRDDREEDEHKALYPLIFSALWGSFVMLSTSYAPLFLIGLETLSFSGYIMAVLPRHPESLKAVVRYFFLGALSTAVLVYGFVLLFGATGSLFFGQYLERTDTEYFYTLQLIGGIFVILGLSFKIGAAPLHFWAPGIYTKTSRSVAAFLMVVPKFALVLALHQFLFSSMPFQFWFFAVLILGGLSLLVGNSLALVQKDFRQLLAYSTISHSGFLLFLIPLQGTRVDASLVYYLTVYSLSTFGIYSCLIGLSKRQDFQISDFSGLYKKAPKQALLLSFFLLSLAGIPFTPGFFAKFFLFFELMQAGGFLVVLFGVFAAIVGAIYYVRTIAVFFKDADGFALENSSSRQFLGWFLLVLSLALVVWPEVFLKFFPSL